MGNSGGMPVIPGWNLLLGKPNNTDTASYEPIVEMAFELSGIYVLRYLHQVVQKF